MFTVVVLTAIPVYKTLYTRKNAYEQLHNDEFLVYHYLALFIIVIVLGYRYDVGSDWSSYKSVYEHYQSNSWMIRKGEVGFTGLTKLLQSFGLNYVWLFLSAAIIPWSLIFVSANKKLLPIILLFLFTDGFFFISMNAIRQFIAIGIFVFAIQYLRNKNIYLYFLSIFIAISFHSSAVILLPLYFLPYGKLNNRYIWLAIILGSFLFRLSPLTINFMESAIRYISSFIPYLEYYLSHFDRGLFDVDGVNSTGLGDMFRIALVFILLFFHNTVIRKYPEARMYLLFTYFGATLSNLFYSIDAMIRVNYYFEIMRSFALAYLFVTLMNGKNEIYRILVIGIVLGYMLIYYIIIEQSFALCSPYNYFIP